MRTVESKESELAFKDATCPLGDTHLVPRIESAPGSKRTGKAGGTTHTPADHHTQSGPLQFEFEGFDEWRSPLS